MDIKTKSILIGLGSSFAAVLVIVLLFLSVSGISSSNQKPTEPSKQKVETVSVDSEGNTVVVFDEGEDDDTGSQSDASSKEASSAVSSQEEETMPPFGRSDIDGITANIGNFGKLVAAVEPVSYEWNTDRIGATGEVEVKLIAEDGSYAVVGVPYDSDDYRVDGEKEGSGEDITEWSLYTDNKKESYRVKAIVWRSNKMKFKLPRGIKIGTAYNDISAAYLKIQNPDKSYQFYEASDVLKDEAKLSAYKKAESAYIGGKVYKTTTLLSSVYKDQPDAFPFADNSKNVLRYGFNSIVDTKDASGQWYIEYATKNSKVVGVYFYMKGADD